MNYIGKSLLRPDAAGKVTGETRFLTELSVPGMLYAAPVYSSIPFGSFRSIDLKQAQKIKGFTAFVGAENIPGENQIGVIIKDQPLFADKIVRYTGDSIGLVVADSFKAARTAAKKVIIDYETSHPLLSINESKNSLNNFIHATNLACSHRVRKGNIKTGFAQSDLILEAHFKTPFQEHYYLEPQGCIVVPESDGTVNIIGSLQCPFYIQKAVAAVLNISLDKVRVEQAPTGGAFGGKEDVPSELCARTAVAARFLGRPVKLVYSRFDDVQTTSKRHPFQMKYKVGVLNDGTLISAEILLEENAGAYATLSSVVSYRSAAQAMGPYSVPNVYVDSNSYYTNLPPAGAFRGFGSPQAAFGHERMMDVIANKLGMDPLALRMKNIIKPGGRTQTNQKIKTGAGAQDTLMQASKAANWPMVPKAGQRYLRGLGISTIHYGNCLGAAGWAMDGAGVHLRINKNGSVSLAFGLVEMGQGAITVITQMAADALGVSAAGITVLPVRTDQVPDSGPAVASRNVIMTGNAIRDAARNILPILKTAAAEMLECEPAEVNINNNQVVNSVNQQALNFSDLANYLYLNKRPVEAKGWWHVRKLDHNSETGLGEAYFSYSFATHVAQVMVDKLTGQVTVENYWAAHDVGKAINPAGIEGQVEGAVSQGIGWAVLEDFKYKEGRVTTPNLSTYLLPTTLDMPKINTIIIENPDPEGPWGALGIGEPSIIPIGAAVANAVSNALGIQMNELPLTPEVVLTALMNKARKKELKSNAN